MEAILASCLGFFVIRNNLSRLFSEENHVIFFHFLFKRNKSKVTNEGKSDDTTVLASSVLDDYVEDTTPNPVGELLEVTQRFSLRPPEFEFVDEEGYEIKSIVLFSRNFEEKYFHHC